MNYSRQTPLESYIAEESTERILYPGFFENQELEIFSTLIINHRSLPIYLGDCWRCFECFFECRDFAMMAEHIMKFHNPVD